MPAGSPTQRLGDRRVVQQGDPEVGFQLFQAALQTLRRVCRVTDEALHLQLTELAGVGAGEAAAESLDSCYADRAASGCDDRRLALEHRDSGSLQQMRVTRSG